MRKLGFVLLLFAVFAIFGANVHDYFPFRLGAMWTYQDSLPDGYSTSTETVINIVDEDGRETVYLLQETETTSDTMRFQFRTDGLYYYDNMLMDMGVERAIEAKVCPENFEVGDSWESFELDTTIEIMGFPVDAYIITDGEIETMETIDAPYGTYECYKIILNTYYEVSSTMFSDTNEYVSKKSWVALDLGIVKDYEFTIDPMSGGGDAEVSYLTDFSCEFVKEIEKNLPEMFEMNAYPNPFNSAVSIDLPFEREVEIYDTDGKLIQTIAKDEEKVWKPAEDIQSGVYIAKAGKISTKLTYIK